MNFYKQSALIPFLLLTLLLGNGSNKYVKGKKVLYMIQSQSEMVERLTREYTKILGMK